MSILIDTAVTASFSDGDIVVWMESGTELRFSVAENTPLTVGTPTELNNIELSPFGIHWPDLDEDLSFRGIVAGDYGQRRVTP